MNELTTYRWSFEEDVQSYARAGFPALSVWRQKLSDFGEAKGIELLSECGMSVSSLMWAGGFTGSDGRSHRECVEDAHDAIKIAQDLHAGCLIVYSGNRAGHTHNHARRLLNSALNDLMPHAAEAGVTLALEPMHAGCAREWTYLTDLDETLELVQSFDSPTLKLAFDSYYFGLQEDICGRLPDLVPHLAVVQLGDARREPDGEQDRCALGNGAIPLEAIVRGLLEAGYDGFFEIKLIGEEIETMEYEKLLADSKQKVDRLLGC
jgi:sugar phosphate isomerase/epimerase